MTPTRMTSAPTLEATCLRGERTSGLGARSL